MLGVKMIPRTLLQPFYEDVKVWNRKVFGNIFEEKCKLYARLQGIQRQLDMGPSKSLNILQTQLWNEYEDTLNQEELFWKQKSRCQWIIEGDRNTRFYHTSTMIRRRRNKILSFQQYGGNALALPPCKYYGMGRRRR
ncbi:reverse transcriptase [Senna tora]|uniref:Reverse transcriptase n=1 Tax=Senna tora TaxID=362788 RepID=A0A834WI55_9FABA|nr:reverse transcriptase [Senna tora]